MNEVHRSTKQHRQVRIDIIAVVVIVRPINTLLDIYWILIKDKMNNINAIRSSTKNQISPTILGMTGRRKKRDMKQPKCFPRRRVSDNFGGSKIAGHLIGHDSGSEITSIVFSKQLFFVGLFICLVNS